MSVRERFRDSAGTLADYEWEVNHATENPHVNTRNMERTAVTSGVGYVRQQGQPSPETLAYSGAILTASQYNAMMDYYKACSTRTIFFLDVSGVEDEVIITSFSPTRHAVVRNPRSPDPWYWTYDIEMEIVS